jgi:hypothetical protein
MFEMEEIGTFRRGGFSGFFGFFIGVCPPRL